MPRRRRRGSKTSGTGPGPVALNRRSRSERPSGEEETVPNAKTAAPAPTHRSSFGVRLQQLAHLDLDEPQAEDLWRNVVRHRRDLLQRLGRDVGQRVALLDFILNVRPQLIEPTIIEATTSSSVAGSLWARSLSTGCLVRNDVPRSPRDRFHTYLA